MMDARQHIDPTPSREYVMNDQTISRLLTNTHSWFNSGVNALGSRRSPLVVGAQQVPQGISSSLHQQHLTTSTSVSNLQGNLANLTGQEVGCSVLAASTKAGTTSEEEDEPIPPPPGFENYILNSILVTEKHQKEHRDKSPSDKSDRQSMDTSDSMDGTSGVPGDADTMSDAPLTKHKSSDDNIKSTSPHANAQKGNAGSSSSNFAECATIADGLTGVLSNL
ncbi:hypothetical protein OWV82_004494 [Melia azedarach]|uniref:Uncharacterized protein n=1 Tax=Melia azedarach TaxID=155640 RepID=A0ACC1YR20_MELAZ|nr:hypothetical protein OWV82_004494 [Melia azedarach]